MEDTQYTNNEVFILGAGGLAREIDSWISNDEKSNLVVKGFFDDNLNSLDDYILDKDILGNLEFLDKGNYILGIMNCEFKEDFINKNSDINLVSYIHSSVKLGSRSSIGKGVVLFPNVIVSCDVKIGTGTFINIGSQIGHDVTIGNNVSIMPSVNLGGGVCIGDNVFIGTGAIILPGVKIPKNTRIGAGSVVMKTIKVSGSYFGNPAKKFF